MGGPGTRLVALRSGNCQQDHKLSTPQSGRGFQKGTMCAHVPLTSRILSGYNWNRYISAGSSKMVRMREAKFSSHAMLSFLCPKHTCFPPRPSPSPQVRSPPSTCDGQCVPRCPFPLTTGLFLRHSHTNPIGVGS